MPEDEKRALQQAIELIGGQVQLARRLGVKQPSVFGWLRDRLPAERVLAVEAITGVRRERLRPDLYPPDEFNAAPHNATEQERQAS